MHILYIEDDPLDADLTQRWCTRKTSNITLEIVGTVAEARQRLSCASTSSYDLILTDMRLPDGDGLEVIRAVHDCDMHVPLVMITGVGDDRMVVTALRAGATDYIIKRIGYLDHLPSALEKAQQRYQSASARRTQPYQVLYAEPYSADAELTKRFLSHTAPHLRFSLVTSGEEALARLDAGSGVGGYHVLLLDYHLPGIDAFDLAKQVWDVRQLDIPIVLVTGKGSEDAALQALRMGVSEYVVKEPGYLERLPWILEQAIVRAEVGRRARQLSLHNAALTRLSRSTTVEHDGLEARLREIITTAAKTLSVERVSVWLYDATQTHIACRALYEQTPDRHSSGGVLLASAYPSYFQALATARVLAAHDAHTDPRTQEFATRYLTPLGITSMLDAPLRVSGKRIGVVCHEHVGPRRTWSQEEETFAASVADFIAMAIETEERQAMAAATHRLEARLLQAQKMEEIGTLASRVAHDFNSFLTGILGYAELAMMDLEKEHPVQEFLQAILKAGERGRALVRQISTGSLQRCQDQQRLYLQEVVADAVTLWQVTLPATLTVETHFAHDAPAILGDPTQIHQVVMNLCRNAAQAIGARPGLLRLSLQTLVTDAALAESAPELHPGAPYVQLRVQDNGPGIEAPVLPHIFEPFFTTKGPTEGTGLGLATVRDILHQHHGAVTVASTPGQGTTFTLYFPVATEPASACDPSLPRQL